MPLQSIGIRMGSVSSAVFAAQGDFLWGNAFYSIMFPSLVASFEGSSLNGVSEDVIQCIGISIQPSTLISLSKNQLLNFSCITFTA